MLYVKLEFLMGVITINTFLHDKVRETMASMRLCSV